MCCVYILSNNYSAENKKQYNASRFTEQNRLILKCIHFTFIVNLHLFTTAVFKWEFVKV